MRFALLAAVVALAASSCGSARTPSHSAPPAAIKDFPATRWVPSDPTYVVAAPTVREAQRALRDTIDSIGMFAGVDVAEVSRELSQLLSIDPLSTEALAGMGIDVEGAMAMFSEDVSPTFVARLSAPEQTQGFFDRQRERGMVTQSVMVDGVEVFTAQLLANVRVSWVIADDWLWVHFTLPIGADPGTSWFTNSRKPQGPGWGRDWEWAQTAAKARKPALTGFIDARQLIASLSPKISDAIACTKLVEPVSRIGIAIEGDGSRATGRLAFDLGPAAQSVAANTLPVPEGFAAQTTGAPLAAQWNLDLLVVRAWLQPCLRAINEDLGWLDRYGVRAGRAVLQGFNPDDKSGAGAFAFDLAHKTFFGSQLDEIPMRSALERNRTFGPHKGHSISIPFVATIEYVLTDKVALAAVGEGLLAKVVGTGTLVPGQVAAIDILPQAMSAEAWKTILEAIDRRSAEGLVERLMRWREGHVAVTIEGTSLLVAATGVRR
jgi:hypothetical protein